MPLLPAMPDIKPSRLLIHFVSQIVLFSWNPTFVLSTWRNLNVNTVLFPAVGQNFKSGYVRKSFNSSTRVNRVETKILVTICKTTKHQCDSCAWQRDWTQNHFSINLRACFSISQLWSWTRDGNILFLLLWQGRLVVGKVSLKVPQKI